MAELSLPEAFQDELRTAWQRYIDLVAPFRPDLYRYCRRLTRDVWDAEDLVQEALLRSFGALGKLHPGVENPRSYLLRAATNCWIDVLRRRGTETETLAASPRPEAARNAGGAVRDAGTTLMQHLSPQERAAVVLKDVFELSLEETSDVLQTTVGAVKAALHRGRARLHDAADESAPERPLPPTELVDRFVAAYNAADMAGLTALLLEHSSVEQLGCAYSSGRKTLEEGFLDKAINGHPEWPAEFQYESARLERAVLDGEPIALGLVMRRGREALEQVMRFEAAEGHVVRIRAYAFCPEAMREIGERLGVRVRTGLYRYPTPAPGKSFEPPRA